MSDDLTALRDRIAEALDQHTTEHLPTPFPADLPEGPWLELARRGNRVTADVVAPVVQAEIDRYRRLLADASTHLRTRCNAGRHDTWGAGHTCAACQLAEQIDTALNPEETP